MSTPGNLTPEQQHVFDHVERNAGAIAQLGDNIFYFGELGMQEFETAKLMTGLLQHGHEDAADVAVVACDQHSRHRQPTNDPRAADLPPRPPSETV